MYRGRRKYRTYWTIFLILAAAVVLALAVGMGLSAPKDTGGDASGGRNGTSTQPGTGSGSGAASEVDDSSAIPPDSSNPSGDLTEEPDQPEEKDEPEAGYDFSQPAPQSDPVDNSYFDDAAFVGDSRTDGFMIYSGIGTGKNLTSNGLSIFKLGEKKALTINGEKYTLLEVLALEAIAAPSTRSGRCSPTL